MVKVKKMRAGQVERYQERMLNATLEERQRLRAEFALAFKTQDFSKVDLTNPNDNYNIKGSERVGEQQIEDLRLAVIGGPLAEKWGIAGEFTKEHSQAMINHDLGLTLDGSKKLTADTIKYEKNYTYKDDQGVEHKVLNANYDRLKRHLKMQIKRPDGLGGEEKIYLQVEPSKIKKVGNDWIYHLDAIKDRPPRDIVLNNGEYQKFQSHLEKQKITIEKKVKGGVEKETVKFKRENLTIKDSLDGDGNRIPIDDSVPCVEMIHSLPKSISTLFALAQQHDPALYVKLINAYSKSVSKVMDKEAMNNLYSQKGEKLDGVYEQFTHCESRTLQPSVHTHIKFSTHGQTESGESKRVDLERFGMNENALDNWTLIDNLINTELVHELKQFGVNFQCQNRDMDLESNRFDPYISKLDIDYGDSEVLKSINANLSESRKQLMQAIAQRRDKITSDRDKALNALEEKRGVLTNDEYKREKAKIEDSHDRRWDWLNTSEGIDEIHSETKNAKQDLSSADLKEEFKGVLDSNGLTRETMEGAINRGGIGHAKQSFANLSNDEIERRVVKKLTETSIAFSEKDLYAAIASQCVGLSIEECQEKAKQIISNPQYLVSFAWNDDLRNQRETVQRYTSEMLVEESNRINDLCIAMTKEQAKGTFSKDREAVEAFISTTTLKPEQADALRQFFSNDESIHLVSGLAGTGKSFTLAKIAEFAASEIGGGKRSYGAALMAATASDLGSKKDKAGNALIQSETIAKYLLMKEFASEEGHPQAAFYQKKLDQMRGQIMFLDEASLVGTSNMADFLQLTHELGMKIQIVGDRYQINSISAGNALCRIFSNVDPAKRNILFDIDRQKGNLDELMAAKIISGATKIDELRKAGHDEATIDRMYDAYMRSGEQVDKLFEKLEREDRIELFETKGQVIEAIVEDFTESDIPLDLRVCLAATNDSTDLLNKGCVETLFKEDRRLPKEKRTFGEQEIELYNTVLESNYKFRTGQRITISENSKVAKNGEIGTLVGIESDPKNPGAYIFQFLKDGEQKPVALKSEFNAAGKLSLPIRHGYALTYTKSQGMTKNPFILYEPSQLNNAASMYIPTTRTITQSKHYCVDSELETVRTQMRRSGLNDDIADMRIGDSNPFISSPEKKIEVLHDEIAIQQLAVQIQQIGRAANDSVLSQQKPAVQLEATNLKEIQNGTNHSTLSTTHQYRRPEQQSGEIPPAHLRGRVLDLSRELVVGDDRRGIETVPSLLLWENVSIDLAKPQAEQHHSLQRTDRSVGESTAAPTAIVNPVEESQFILNIEAGLIDVSQVDEAGRTPLHDAIINQQPLEEIQAIINAGSDVNATDKSQATPLLYAVLYGQDVMPLINAGAGASVNIADCEGKTALHWAAEKGQLENVKHLLIAGSDPTLLDKESNYAEDLATSELMKITLNKAKNACERQEIITEQTLDPVKTLVTPHSQTRQQQQKRGGFSM